jgi:hypothetical protein
MAWILFSKQQMMPHIKIHPRHILNTSSGIYAKWEMNLWSCRDTWMIPVPVDIIVCVVY